MTRRPGDLTPCAGGLLSCGPATKRTADDAPLCARCYAGLQQEQRSSNAIAGRVNRIVADVLGVEDARVLPGARLREDLGADALDLCEIAVQLHEQLGILSFDGWRPWTEDCLTVGEIEARVTAGAARA